MSIKKVQKKAKAILSALECPDGELSIVLVDDSAMAQLNQQYLHRQGPTNVIAFPMREGEFADVNAQLLGDVVISLDTCRRESRADGIAFERRLEELLIHGILHLFGYDHEDSSERADRMEQKSNELLALMSGLKEQYRPC
jgi:probable rRNA maturation factor